MGGHLTFLLPPGGGLQRLSGPDSYGQDKWGLWAGPPGVTLRVTVTWSGCPGPTRQVCGDPEVSNFLLWPTSYLWARHTSRAGPACPHWEATCLWALEFSCADGLEQAQGVHG